MTVRGPITLMDVAKHAGVSLATASRVINGSDRRVSSALREKVTASAEELRYVRNAYAQALARSRTSIAGVIIYDIGHPYFAGVIRGIQRIAAGAGQIVLVCNSNCDPARELEYVTLLHEHRAATIVMAASGYDPAYTQRLERQLDSFIEGGGHVALIGRTQPNIGAVLPDSYGGMLALGNELTRLGHRKVAIIGGPPLTVVDDRTAGIRAALDAVGAPISDRWIVRGDLHRASAEAAVHEMYARGLDPTAIVAINDEMAIGALAALRALGKRVPTDVSLAGFDDLAVVADLDPALTTVHVPLEEIGERAMRIALYDGDDTAQNERVATRLVVRASTAPPR